MSDQPHRYAALGSEPVKTISRDELKAKLDAGDDLKLVQGDAGQAVDLRAVDHYQDLPRRGYRHVRRYAWGLLDWEDAGLPLEGSFVEPRP